MNIRVGLELVARGEKPVTDLTAVRLAAIVQTHLKDYIFSNLLSLFVFILTNSREEDAVPHLEQ